jgi:AcrR family transcriptional regulator
LNLVQTLNVVHVPHLSAVPASKRARTRQKRRQQFLAVAAEIVSRDGLEGLTMQALATELDCAIGTAYTYFESKAALVAAVQRNALDTLARSLHLAQAGWDRYLDDAARDPGEAALARLLAFGGFLRAAAVAYPNEVALLQVVLGAHSADLPDDQAVTNADVAARFLDEPRALLGAAEGRALDRGDAWGRAVSWVAALNGVLLLEGLGRADPRTFQPAALARQLTIDLVVGWGADPAVVARAALHVERLAALEPLAPPVPPIDVT